MERESLTKELAKGIASKNLKGLYLLREYLEENFVVEVFKEKLISQNYICLLVNFIERKLDIPLLKEEVRGILFSEFYFYLLKSKEENIDIIEEDILRSFPNFYQKLYKEMIHFFFQELEKMREIYSNVKGDREKFVKEVLNIITMYPENLEFPDLEVADKVYNFCKEYRNITGII